MRFPGRRKHKHYFPVQTRDPLLRAAGVEQATIISDFIAGKFQAATSYQFGTINPDLNYVWWSTTTAKPVVTQASGRRNGRNMRHLGYDKKSTPLERITVPNSLRLSPVGETLAHRQFRTD